MTGTGSENGDFWPRVGFWEVYLKLWDCFGREIGAHSFFETA